METKSHTYYLNKSVALSMYDLLLPSGIKGPNKYLQFGVCSCIGFKELRIRHVFRYFLFGYNSEYFDKQLHISHN